MVQCMSVCLSCCRNSLMRLFFGRAAADDKPLRMVKTVLHELVKIRGTAIKGHLSMVPIDMEPQPIILAYIDLNLQVICVWLIWREPNVLVSFFVNSTWKKY